MQERSEANDVPYGHASMLLLGEGSEATEPYNKYDKIRPHSIRSLQLDQKVRLLSFRPEKFDLFTATHFMPIPETHGNRKISQVTNCIKPNDFKPNGNKPSDSLPPLRSLRDLRSRSVFASVRLRLARLEHMRPPRGRGALEKMGT